MSQTPPNRMAALKDDGFIDFYELLGVEPDATVTRIRTNINALYNEAQANRDHRNLNRRREYQTLLQLLPQARELLLDEKKRERYDVFREEVERCMASISFEDWVRSLEEEAETAQSGRSAVLGVQGGEQEAAQAAAQSATTKPPRPKPISRVVIGSDPAGARSGGASLIGTIAAIAVFFVLLGVLRFLLNLDLPIALIVACLAGIVVWFVARSASSRTAV